MAGAVASVGRIGPNAITQCMAALQDSIGAVACAELMRRCGLQAHVQAPPKQMVDEADVVTLHHAMRAELGLAQARVLSREAGLRTGDYLLANRIPPPMCWLLPRLPAALASRVLLAAIARHAWTFCGSGIFSVQHPGGGQPLRLTITNCATCRDERADEPLCDYYAATFERLFGTLVHPQTRVQEIACAAMGAQACVFELRW